MLVRRLSGRLERVGSSGWGHARCWVLRDRALRLWDFWAHPVAGFAGGWGGCRPYFENYTVDASILKKTLCMLSGVWGVECSILNGSAHVISSL